MEEQEDTSSVPCQDLDAMSREIRVFLSFLALTVLLPLLPAKDSPEVTVLR